MLMRFSDPKPFIFLANTKVASTSIEFCDEIAGSCDIRVRKTQFGKHMVLPKIEKTFRHIFDVEPIENFTIAMTVREPIDWFRSWYNYRQMPDNRGSERTSYGLSPEEFFHNVFTHENVDQARMNPSRPMRVLRYGEHLSDDLARFCSDMKLPAPNLPRKNASKPTRADFSPELISAVRSRFHRDVVLWDSANEAPSV